MKTFAIYIKSHCEYPDFEATTEAETKKEAVQKFSKMPQLVEFSEKTLSNLVD